MAIQMKRNYFYIDGGRVADYRYDGPMDLFQTWDEANMVLSARKRERAAELRAELAALESKEE